MQDAYNLGWKLAAVLEGPPIELLDSYEEERRPVAAGVLGLSTGLLTEMQQGKMRQGRNVQQLEISYAGYSLAQGGGNRGNAPIAGDRAPDAKLMGTAGQPRRLFDPFAGPHWTLLQYGEARTEITARRGLQIHGIGEGLELHDASGQFQRAYGVETGANVLIRPDGQSV